MRQHPRREAGPHPDDRGQAGAIATAFLLTMVPVFVVLIGIAFDIGQGYTANARAINVAEQAARAGAQQIDLDDVRGSNGFHLDEGNAEAAAEAFLSNAGFPGTATTPTNESVHVETTWSVPTAFLGLIGISDFSGTASADARMAVGVNNEVPLP